MPKVKILISESTDPWFNLATEDWIFQDMSDVDTILFLWRNAETVVIGRSQNPWAECYLERMQQDGICLARRQSGGGAVFHDLGNTNFTFLAKKPRHHVAQNFEIIIGALQKFNIQARVSGRNDMVIDLIESESLKVEKKISGSAFREKKDRSFHHGTLLINADLQKLQNYIHPNQKKLMAKGIQSVRSRVINLQEINPAIHHEELCAAIIEEFNNYHNVQSIPALLTLQNLQQIASLNEHYQHLKSWDWLYGQTLEFTHQFAERFDWGHIEIQLDVQNGIIKDNRIYSDSLYPDLIDSLAIELRGIRYDPQAITQVIQTLQGKFSSQHILLDELGAWIVEQVG